MEVGCCWVASEFGDFSRTGHRVGLSRGGTNDVRADTEVLRWGKPRFLRAQSA